MTPTKAASVFRELLQTPDGELVMFTRRAGLPSSPSVEDLQRARELLAALGDALETGTGRDWDRVRASWAGLRTKQDLFAAPPPVVVASSTEPAKPALVGRVVVQKPSLGDVAPGAAGSAAAPQARFVPVARPRHAPGSGIVPPDAPPEPSAHGYAPPAPLAPEPVAPPAPAAPAPQAGGRAGEDDWMPPLPPPPALLAPLAPEPAGGVPLGPFTRAVAPSPALAPAADPWQAGQGAVAPTPPAARPAAPAAATPPVARPSVRPPAAPPPPPRRQAAAVAPPGQVTAAAAGSQAPGGSPYESVAAYAGFCAACAEYPERLAQTMAGYGIADDHARGALDAAWQERFDDEPELLGRWEQLFSSFRTSLRQGR